MMRISTFCDKPAVLNPEQEKLNTYAEAVYHFGNKEIVSNCIYV